MERESSVTPCMLYGTGGLGSRLAELGLGFGPEGMTSLLSGAIRMALSCSYAFRTEAARDLEDKGANAGRVIMPFRGMAGL